MENQHSCRGRAVSFCSASQFAVTALFFVLLGFAQQADANQWAERYGGGGEDYANDAVQTSDGGYIVAARTNSFGAGSLDGWILKLDREGAIQWQKALGGSYLDNLTAIRQTRDGGYVAAGFFTTSAGLQPWVVKLTPAGNVEWQHILQHAQEGRAFAVEQTGEGGYIVAGSLGTMTTSAFVVKLDNTGAIVWQKAYVIAGWSAAASLQQTADGGYIVAGGESASVPSALKAWLLKLNGEGNVEWQKSYGGLGVSGANSVRQTRDGGYVFAGSTTLAERTQAWVVRLDTSGAILWQKAFGPNTAASVVRETSDSRYVVTGQISSLGKGGSEGWVAKLDGSGGSLWQYAFGEGGTDYFASLSLTADGGFVVAGRLESPSSASDSNAWVLKLPAIGAIGICPYVTTVSPAVATTTVVPEDTAAVSSVPGFVAAVPAASATVTAGSRTEQCGWNLAAMLIHAPSTQEIYVYGPVVSPVLGYPASTIKPVAVGDMAGGVEEIQVSLLGYAEPFDIYLAFAITGYPGLYFLDSSNVLHLYAGGSLIKWRDGITDFLVDESLFGVFPAAAVPAGLLNIYMLVSPHDSLASYYVWATHN